MAKMTASRRMRPADAKLMLSNTLRIKELEEMAQVQQETIVELAKSIEGLQKTVTSAVKLLDTMTKRINEG